MSVFGVVLVRIFPHSDWIRTRIIPNMDTFYTVLCINKRFVVFRTGSRPSFVLVSTWTIVNVLISFLFICVFPLTNTRNSFIELGFLHRNESSKTHQMLQALISNNLFPLFKLALITVSYSEFFNLENWKVDIVDTNLLMVSTKH